MPRPKSQAQARFFGAVAGGRGGKASTARRKGFGRLDARDSLRGVPVHTLPPVYRNPALGRKRDPATGRFLPHSADVKPR